jgi:hypothetical protein
MGNWTREYICLGVDNSTVEPHGPYRIDWPPCVAQYCHFWRPFCDLSWFKTKSDKEGEKLHNKAVYCNPLDPVLHSAVSLGVWLSLNQNTFRDNSESVFIQHDTHIGSATHRYCEQLSSHNESVLGYCADIHQDDVGTWPKKRQCHTCVVCNNGPTTNCLNCKLGHCLCGLDNPNHSTFSVLPRTSEWSLEWSIQNPPLIGQKTTSHLNSDLKLAQKEVVRILYWVVAMSTSKWRQ